MAAGDIRAQSQPSQLAIAGDIRAQMQETYEPRISRRSLPSLAALLVLLAPGSPAAALPPQFGELETEIRDLLAEDADWGAGIVRLAWHASGTYDRISKTGGSQRGTIRFQEELAQGANVGLDAVVERLQELKDNHPDISYGDFYTFAGARAIEILGGPKIPWRSGRVDAIDPAEMSPDGRLPTPDVGGPPQNAAALRQVFGRMGFKDQEIVALSGAHAIGRCRPSMTGYIGPWTFTPRQFSNQYFVNLVEQTWIENEIHEGLLQYRAAGKNNATQYESNIMMLPSDIALIEDPAFRKVVEEYARDEKRFFKDFAAAFSRLLELGTKNLRG